MAQHALNGTGSMLVVSIGGGHYVAARRFSVVSSTARRQGSGSLPSLAWAAAVIPEAAQFVPSAP